MNALIVEIELKKPDHDCGPDCFCWQPDSGEENTAKGQPVVEKVAAKRIQRSASGTVVRFPKVS
jgi:hypothetical protein